MVIICEGVYFLAQPWINRFAMHEWCPALSSNSLLHLVIAPMVSHLRISIAAGTLPCPHYRYGTPVT